MEARLISPLGLDECVSRLREAICPPLDYVVSSPVVGYVLDNFVCVRRRSLLRNFFHAVLRAELTAYSAGTRVDLDSGLSITVLMYSLLAGAIAAAVSGMSIAALFGASWSSALPPLGWGFLALSLPLLVGLAFAGHRVTAEDNAFLVSWLRQLLDANQPE